MLIDATIQKIGGSTFARLPPDVVRTLGLMPGETVQLNIVKRGITGAQLRRYLEQSPAPAEWKESATNWRKERPRGSKDD
jgi:antitoxin component of MazEF toxin-antitoxin module